MLAQLPKDYTFSIKGCTLTYLLFSYNVELSNSFGIPPNVLFVQKNRLFKYFPDY